MQNIANDNPYVTIMGLMSYLSNRRDCAKAWLNDESEDRKYKAEAVSYINREIIKYLDLSYEGIGFEDIKSAHRDHS